MTLGQILRDAYWYPLFYWDIPGTGGEVHIVQAAAAKRVGTAPCAWHVQQLEPSETLRQGWIYQEPVPNRLQTEQHAQQQQGRPRRPGLRTACGRVLDGEPGS